MSSNMASTNGLPSRIGVIPKCQVARGSWRIDDSFHPSPGGPLLPLATTFPLPFISFFVSLCWDFYMLCRGEREVRRGVDDRQGGKGMKKCKWKFDTWDIGDQQTYLGCTTPPTLRSPPSWLCTLGFSLPYLLLCIRHPHKTHPHIQPSLQEVGKGQEVFHSEGCSKATTVQHARKVWQRVKSTPVQVTVVGIIWDVQWVRVWRYQDVLCGHGGERWPSQLVESMGQEGMMYFY